MPFVNTDILINTIHKVNKCDKDSTFHLFGTFRIDKINMNIDTQIVSYNKISIIFPLIYFV